MAGNDFVFVQLTPAGEKQANGQPLRVSNGMRTFLFTPVGQPVRVEKNYEWNAVLSQHFTIGGDALFELVPAPASPAAAAAPATHTA